jgi:hypothetical protein
MEDVDRAAPSAESHDVACHLWELVDAIDRTIEGSVARAPAGLYLQVAQLGLLAEQAWVLGEVGDEASSQARVRFDKLLLLVLQGLSGFGDVASAAAGAAMKVKRAH